MADVSRRIGLSSNESLDSQGDSITLRYRVQYDSVPSNFYTALARGRAASGDPLPARRSLYSSPSAILIASGFQASISWVGEGNKSVWEWDVTFSPPPQGEGSGDSGIAQITNPLERPPVFNVSYMDIEVPITVAKNVEYLARGNGSGEARPGGTAGPIVNAAGIQPDEPRMTNDRFEVLLIHKNYATLADIVERNRDFKRSTNDGTIQGYGVRELRYMLTESQGVQYENGYTFWPGLTTILAEPTTDLILDNVGYDYWDPVSGELVRAKDSDGDQYTDPINLNAAGSLSVTGATQITWRFLEEKDYGPLFV